MCMFSLGDFLYLFFLFAGGGRGVWVATKWDLFWGVGGGGGHVWSALRLRLRLGIVSGVGYTQIYFLGGMFDTYILRKGCGAKSSVDCKPT